MPQSALPAFSAEFKVATADPSELPCSLAGLPVAAAQHLELAGLAYTRDSIAEFHLGEALKLAPEHLAVQVGYYRYLFYKGRLQEALTQLDVCLGKAAAHSGLPIEWRNARPQDAEFGSLDAIWARFYLFALKAHGYIKMRLGDLEGGSEAIRKALQLDPSDKVGAKILLEVLARQGVDEYE
jgi:tetratricopeptide (TPR) repeat protein